MNRQRAHVPDVRHIGKQLERLDEALSGVGAAFDFESENRSRAPRRVFLRELVVRRGDEAGMADGFDALVPVQEFDDGLRVGQMPLHPERKGLQPLSQKEGVEGGDDGAGVAQQHRANPRDERAGPDGGECQAVVTLVRLGQQRELAVRPVEVALLDDGPAERRAVAAEEFRRRLDYDVRAVFKGPDVVRRADRVVDDQRNAVLVRNFRKGLDVEDVTLGIGDALAVQGAGAVVDERAPRFGVVRILDESDDDADLGEGDFQEVVRAAVQRRRRDDLVACLGDVEECVKF